MKSRSRSSRRLRNPIQKESKDKPFFTPAGRESSPVQEDSAFFQPKLNIHTPGDQFEQEADQVASRVANGPSKEGQVRQESWGRPVQDKEEEKLPAQDKMEEEEPPSQDKMEEEEPPVQDKEEEKMPAQDKMEEEPPSQDKMEEEEPPSQDKEEEKMPAQDKMEEEEPVGQRSDRMKEENKPMMGTVSRPTSHQQAIGAKLAGSKGRGGALPKGTRSEMEAGIGAPLDNITIHTDGDAAEMSERLHARAFTHGSDIYFNQGEYNPNSQEGKKLLAHELAHTQQQLSGRAAPSVQRTIGDGHDLSSPRFAGDSRLEAAFDDERYVRNWSEGAHVVKLQQALVDAGIPLPEFGVDGKFGPETDRAVREYQRANGLQVDGIVGPETIGDLDQRFGGNAPPAVRGLQQTLTQLLNNGTNGREVCDAILAAPQAERNVVRSNRNLMDRLRTALSRESFARNRKRLGDQPPSGADLLDRTEVSAAFTNAWLDSDVMNLNNRHEEGGWFVFDWVDNSISTVRVPAGGRADLATIVGTRPADTETRQVVAWFHTHPNPAGLDPVTGSVMGLGPSGPPGGDVGFSNAVALPGMVREYAPPGTRVGGATHDLAFGPVRAAVNPGIQDCSVE
jgi:peptidoglycan hydrolase-like protein with peptidoglycan-binding domain